MLKSLCNETHSEIAPAPQKLRPEGLCPQQAPAVALCLVLLGLGLAVQLSPLAAGPSPRTPARLFDEFDLTLAPGHRTEAVGPFFYSEQKETQRIWAVPPLLSYTRDPETESKEFDFLYPVMTYDRYGEQYRWQFFQVLSFAGGPTQTRNRARPLHPVPALFSATLLGPEPELHGGLSVLWAPQTPACSGTTSSSRMFPLYSETRKKDVVTDNYLWPLFSLRHGDGAARLEVLAAGRERAQRCHYPNQRLRRRYHHWRARQLLCALAAVLQQREAGSAPPTSSGSSPLSPPTASCVRRCATRLPSFGPSSTTWMTGRRNTTSGMPPGR